MGDFPAILQLPHGGIHITSLSYNSAGGNGGVTVGASAVWPVANTAIYVPFRIGEPILVRKLFWTNGSAVAGNVDCGIYDAAGTRIISTGSTAQATTNTVQAVNITDTMLGAGVFYLALALSDGAATVFRDNPSIQVCRILGLLEETSALPLPATATFATVVSAFVPIFGLVGDIAAV